MSNIFISSKLYPELRAMSFLELQKEENYKSYQMTVEEERDRFYIITTLKCPCKCDFCLFILDADKIKDCGDAEMANHVADVLRAFSDTNFSVSITGGEPLMFRKRIVAILDSIRENAKPDMVRWIGFGTSGTTGIPTYLNDYPEFRFDIHLSRHHYERDKQISAFVNKVKISDALDFKERLGSHVNVFLSCNLIRGGIDDLDGMKRYIEYAAGQGVSAVTFRELNKVADDASIYNDKHILDYIEYYKNDIVPLQDAIDWIENDGGFSFVSQDIRPFIYHERWKCNRTGVEIKFRRVDEEQLLQYNSGFDGIDEIVLHPDGLITGCWDRNQKVIAFEKQTI